jgi:hypothetical protein
LAFGVEINKDVVRRILGLHYRPESDSGGPSWLTFLGQPLMESIQGIVVGAEILRRCLTANRSIEHPAQGPAINDAALNTKTNHATGELIDHDENPVRSQRCGFTAEKILTPQNCPSCAGLILADCGTRLPLHREFLCHGGFEPRDRD